MKIPDENSLKAAVEVLRVSRPALEIISAAREVLRSNCRLVEGHKSITRELLGPLHEMLYLAAKYKFKIKIGIVDPELELTGSILAFGNAKIVCPYSQSDWVSWKNFVDPREGTLNDKGIAAFYYLNHALGELDEYKAEDGGLMLVYCNRDGTYDLPRPDYTGWVGRVKKNEPTGLTKS